MKLLIEAILKFILGTAIIACLLFLPAGDLHYWQAWLFLGALAVPMLILVIYLLIKRPKLLESRLQIKEKLQRQGILIGFSSLMFLACFTFAGVNYHSNWHSFPVWANLTAAVLFAITFLAYAKIMNANRYLSHTIKVVKNQTVIDTGPYRIVRHPMYTITVILFLLTPIILNSPISLLISLVYPFLIANRIKDEEAFLEKHLKGYKAYQKKTKYRLIPFVW